jgi:hypothetical protein
MRISHVIKGSRPVTVELALLLGRAFEQSLHYWQNLQNALADSGISCGHVHGLVRGVTPCLQRARAMHPYIQ